MLEQRVARWPQQWLEQGRQEGEVNLLKSLARHRFGDLPHWAVERLDRADVGTLERWSHRLLDAESLEDVFEEDLG